MQGLHLIIMASLVTYVNAVYIMCVNQKKEKDLRMTYNNTPLHENTKKKNNRVSGRYFITKKEAVRVFGDKTARILSAIDSFLRKENFGKNVKGTKWVFSTFEYLSEYLCISLRHIKRLMAELRKKGIIKIQKLADYRSNRTNYYTIDYHCLHSFMAPQDPLQTPSSPCEDVIEDTSLDQKMAPWTCHKGTILSTVNTNTDKLNKSKKMIQKNVKKEVDEKNHPKSPLKKNIATDMLTVWNDTVSKAKTVMSKNLACYLVSAYNTKFSKDASVWKKYCEKIASSAYLMGESFHLTLSWALKFSTIDRLERGELGVKGPVFDTSLPSEDTLLDKAKKHLLDLEKDGHEDPRCVGMRQKLLRHYGAGNYLSWIAPLSFFIDEGQVRFHAKSAFHKETIVQKFSQVLSL